MGAIDQPHNPAERTLTLSEMLGFVDAAMVRVGLDEQRAKMLRQILIWGDPVVSESDLQPLPDVMDMQIALETVETWFNSRPSTSLALNADVMRVMNAVGRPVTLRD